MTERRLLIIEDDPGLSTQMRWCFEDVEVFVASNAQEAQALIAREEPQVVTLDLGLPPEPGGTRIGFELLDLINRQTPDTKVIVITGREEREHALKAVAHGAYDFYQKPIDADTLTFVVDRAFRLWSLEEENRLLASHAASTPLDGLITASASMFDIIRQLQRVAPTDATVLIGGETGTGKEVIARAVHKLSARSTGPFVAINCAAIPENLLESELFGHEKGAFTGAVARKIGKVEAASGGTLMLDEIGDMPLQLQAKILRFLQQRTVERIGSTHEIPVDVRVVSATHRDLQSMVAEGAFRQDLYFRLAEISFALPALRERGDDVVLIAKALLARHATNRTLRFSQDALSALTGWNWPGNIRELENRVRRASILADGRLVTARDLELKPPEYSIEDNMPLDLREVRARGERDAIQRAMARAQDNVSKAARLLGISRPTLYSLLQKYEISAAGSTDE
ncbi:MAG: PEP-CTERM-box response regulator transcription factor [Pseudomonadales bacterium]